MATMSDEKGSLNEVEITKELELGDPPLDDKAERKLNAKIDIRLIPIFFVLMIVGYIDRINIGKGSLRPHIDIKEQADTT